MASDDFNRAAENPLGSPWTLWRDYAIEIETTGSCQGTQASASSHGAYYTTSSEASSEITVGAAGAADNLYSGPAIHCSGSGGASDGYAAYINGGICVVGRFDDNSFTTLKTYGSQPTIQSGDVIRIWRDTGDGNKIKVSLNGSTLSTGDESTDTTYTSGSPGIFIYDPGTTFDAWTDGASGGSGSSFMKFLALVANQTIG